MADHLQRFMSSAIVLWIVQIPRFSVILQVAVTIGIALITLAHYKSRRVTVKSLPTPSGASWIWGHEKTVFAKEPGRAFRDWTSELGLTYRIKAAFGAPDILVLCDPGAIAHILQKKVFDYHHSRVVRPRVARLLGKGLGWVEGESEHKRMKSLVLPPLSAENIKACTHDIREAALRVVSDLVAQTENDPAASTVNILDWTGRATLNVVGRMAFRHDFEGGNSEDAQRILNARRQGVSPIARYAGFITLMLLRRFPILNDLPIQAIQAQGILKTTIQSGVAREMIRRNSNLSTEAKKKDNRDLLSRLLVAYEEGKIGQDELYSHISTFIVTASDTTTQTLAFTIYELARHPEVQCRLREELAEFNGEPTYEDFQTKLPYLDAVMREALRIYAGLPYMERIATKPDVIPLREGVVLADGTILKMINISAGQTVIIPIVAIHRLDEVWGDGDSFRPERWIQGLPPQDKLCSGWGNMLAFSDGPRSCIGSRLAMFQYKVILTSLMQSFKFKPAQAQIEVRIASSLQPLVAGETEKGPMLPVELELA